MLGIHITKSFAGKNDPISEHMTEAISQAKKAGIKLSAASIFITGPRNYTMNITEPGAERIRKVVEEHKLTLISHSSYFNLPWDQKPIVMKSLTEEIKVAKLCRATGIVIHMGLSATQTKVVDAMAKLANPDVVLYLEPTAQTEAKALYSKVEQIEELFAALNKAKIRGVGFCLDTAHMWASGSSMIKPKKMLDRLLQISEKYSAPMMFHLNDSKTEFGRGKDKHEPLLSGDVWKDSPESLTELIDFATQNKMPLILERHDGTYEADYQTLKTLKRFTV